MINVRHPRVLVLSKQHSIYFDPFLHIKNLSRCHLQKIMHNDHWCSINVIIQ